MTLPNDDTVRSLADLLVMDEMEDVTSITSSTPNVPQRENGVKKGSASSIPISPISKEAPLRDEMDDSVFGDVPLEEAPTITFNVAPRKSECHVSQLPHGSTSSDQEKKTNLHRHASLRSQVSLPSSF